MVGTTSDAQAVTVRNTGAEPLAIFTFRLNGADAADFAQGADCPVSPDTLPVGSACTIYVSFTSAQRGRQGCVARDRRQRSIEPADGSSERSRALGPGREPCPERAELPLADVGDGKPDPVDLAFEHRRRAARARQRRHQRPRRGRLQPDERLPGLAERGCQLLGLGDLCSERGRTAQRGPDAERQRG